MQAGAQQAFVMTARRVQNTLALIRAPGASFERHGALVKPLL
jgi:hypothetical protein